jgi:Terpene synthase family 2, C-terminal metal binding
MNSQDRQPIFDPSPEKQRIKELAPVLEARLAGFAGCHGLARDISFKGLALTIASAAPFATEEMLSPLAKAGLLIVMIDDMLDDLSLRESDIDERLRQVNEVVCGGTPVDGGHLGAAVLDFRQELEAFPLFAVLYPEWVSSFRRMLAGMVVESNYRPDASGAVPGTMPSLEDYLFYASYSIGIPVYAVSGAIVFGDPSVVQKSAEYHALAEEAGRAVRLANDLATRKREENEKVVNAFSIVLAARQNAGEPLDGLEALVEAQIWDEIRRRLDRCRSMAVQVGTDSGKPERFVVDLAFVVCGFYGLGDY